MKSYPPYCDWSASAGSKYVSLYSTYSTYIDVYLLLYGSLNCLVHHHFIALYR